MKNKYFISYLLILWFNFNYEGGMNISSIIVLIVTYIYYHRKEEYSNIAAVMWGFLRYFEFEFDENKLE
jgi:hypothetical protein